MTGTRPAVAVAGLAALALTAAAVGSTGTPSRFAGRTAEVGSSGEVGRGPVNDEIVLARLDPTGLPQRAVLVSRVTVPGAEREVVDPASTTNVRYLDRLGRPEVSPDGVRLVVGGQRPRVLTEARFDQPLPVALHARYTLDGRVVPATEIPGATGELAVTYTLTNTTARPSRLTYRDAAGQRQRTDRPVFVPFQGTLSATLPPNAELLAAPEAMLSSDERGWTVVRWNVALFPPISQPIQELQLTVRTDRATIPGAQVLLQPAGADQDPGTDFSADLLEASTGANTEVYDGLQALDSAAGYLAAGSDQLALGLGRLSAGTDSARTAAQTLVRGVRTLADGADAAAGATGSLAAGADGLASGAGELAAGSRQLAGALAAAATGARSLESVTAQLSAATDADVAAALGPLLRAGTRIVSGLRLAADRVGGPDDPILDLTDPIPPDADRVCPVGATAPPDDDCVTIYQGVRALRDALVLLQDRWDQVRPDWDRALAAVLEAADDLDAIGAEADTAAAGGRELHEELCAGTAPQLDAPSCRRLAEVARAAGSARDAAAQALPDLSRLRQTLPVTGGLPDVVAEVVDSALAGTERLLIAVEAAGLMLGDGTAEEPGLAAGMATLNAGLRQVSDDLTASQRELAGALDLLGAGTRELRVGIDETAAGARRLAGGAEQVAAGAQEAAVGTRTLAQGSAQLARGTRAAASGAEGLSSGLEALAGGARTSASAGQRLAEGAGSLGQLGTGPALDQVLSGSVDVALADTWLRASARRAVDALPYGPPEGAQGTVAYVFTLEPVPAPRSFWERVRAVFGG